MAAELLLKALQIIDRVDIAALLKYNLASLDRNYLAHWIKQLGLSNDFTAIWEETLPDKQPPIN